MATMRLDGESFELAEGLVICGLLLVRRPLPLPALRRAQPGRAGACSGSLRAQRGGAEGRMRQAWSLPTISVVVGEHGPWV